MPAPAVIPALIMYIKIVAVKKLVVEYIIRLNTSVGPWNVVRCNPRLDTTN